jgi:hypothetical protein
MKRKVAKGAILLGIYVAAVIGLAPAAAGAQVPAPDWHCPPDNCYQL